MKDLVTCSEQMRRTGVRRICVISGEPDWVRESALTFQRQLSGDWVTLSPDNHFSASVIAPSAVRQLLGREFLHGIFDARSGFHAEALAALSGTLVAGSWLLLLLPSQESWSVWQDQDSLRWGDTPQPLAVPRFMHHLQQILAADPQVSYWFQHQSLMLASLPDNAEWQCHAPQQQADILAAIGGMSQGVAVLTAPRGRGKSALAGMLARDNPGARVSAPARVSVEVLQQFAGPNLDFIAPDALAAEQDDPQDRWLIVDEAAAIPAPLLSQMIRRFRRVLLCTTVQGYEGTGRGFLLKFCAGLPGVRYYSLSEPLRWSVNDPLEAFISALFLFDDTLPVPQQGTWQVATLPADSWLRCPQKAHTVYRLLTAAHYRTSPLDLRRMMDAPGMHFLLAEDDHSLRGAVWMLEEGGLSRALSDAVWAGFRRPKGNLVAQSLAAHAGFPQAARLKSLRISRIAVQGNVRRQGVGQALVSAAIEGARNIDFLSVSFGYTAELWQFWQHCGFHLVRLGTQREASSGCYTAMAILPVTEAGRALLTAAEQRLKRDAASLKQRWFDGEDGDCLPRVAPQVTTELNDDDWQELAGFGWGQRPFEAAFPALKRLAEVTPRVSPLLSTLSAYGGEDLEQAAMIRCGGRKAWLNGLRTEVTHALLALQPLLADEWRQRLANCR